MRRESLLWGRFLLPLFITLEMEVPKNDHERSIYYGIINAKKELVEEQDGQMLFLEVLQIAKAMQKKL